MEDGKKEKELEEAGPRVSSPDLVLGFSLWQFLWEAIVIIYINRTSYRSPNSIPEFNEKETSSLGAS